MTVHLRSRSGRVGVVERVGAGVERCLELVDEHEVERRPSAPADRRAATAIRLQPKSHDTVRPARFSRFTQRIHAVRSRGVSARWTWSAAMRGQRVEQPRLEHRVHAVVGDERAIGGGGERGRDRVRLAALPQVVDADALAAQSRGGVRRLSALRIAVGTPEPRRGHRGDHRAAADGGVEGVGLHFLARAPAAARARRRPGPRRRRRR